MGKVLVHWTQGDVDGILSRTGSIINVGSAGHSFSTENIYAFKCPAGATFTNLAYSINNATTGPVMALRVGASGPPLANGNLVAPGKDSTAGVYRNDTQSDVILPSTWFDVLFTAQSGLALCYWIRFVFSATNGHGTPYTAWKSGANNNGSGATYYFTPWGQNLAVLSTDETQSKARMRSSGIASFMQTEVTIARATPSTMVSRIGRSGGAMVNGSQTITINGTGILVDTSNSDSINSGDDFDFAVTNSTGTDTLSLDVFGMYFAALGATTDMFFRPNTATVFTAGSSPTYFPFGGGMNSGLGSTTEANMQVQHGFPATVSNMRMAVTAVSSLVGSPTVNYRVNGANGNQVFTVNGTGLFEDTSNVDQVGENDGCCIQISGGSSGTFTAPWMGVTELPTVIPPPTMIGQNLN